MTNFKRAWGILQSRVAPGIPFLAGSLIILLARWGSNAPGVAGYFLGNASHFLLMGFFGAVLGTILSWNDRITRRVSFITTLCFAALLLRWSFGAVGERASHSVPVDDRPIRIFYANIGWPHMRRLNDLSAIIAAEDPDMVGLVEYDPESDTILANTLAAYPYSIRKFREDRFGVALFSRIPFSDSQIVTYDATGIPTIRARAHSPAFTLWLTHPVPPSNAELRDYRDGALAALAGVVAQESGPRVVIGDLNTTELGAGYESLAAVMKDSRRGYGWSPTWAPFSHVLAPLNLFMTIPLDHAFVSDEVEVIDRHVGTNFGSDHLPVTVTILVNSRQITKL